MAGASVRWEVMIMSLKDIFLNGGGIRQSLREFFFCVFDAPEQFIVKMQDSGALPDGRLLQS